MPDKYLLGILNSKLIHYLFEQILPKLRGGFYEPSYVFFKDFPIKKADLKNREEKTLHDELIKLTDTIISLHKERLNIKVPGLIEQINNKIEITDQRINETVYKLYKLSETEIEVIEKTIKELKEVKVD
jgi:hypothetical protein